jgi:hypothetical protein
MSLAEVLGQGGAFSFTRRGGLERDRPALAYGLGLLSWLVKSPLRRVANSVGSCGGTTHSESCSEGGSGGSCSGVSSGSRTNPNSSVDCPFFGGPLFQEDEHLERFVRLRPRVLDGVYEPRLVVVDHEAGDPSLLLERGDASLVELSARPEVSGHWIAPDDLSEGIEASWPALGGEVDVLDPGRIGRVAGRPLPTAKSRPPLSLLPCDAPASAGKRRRLNSAIPAADPCPLLVSSKTLSLVARRGRLIRLALRMQIHAEVSLR